MSDLHEEVVDSASEVDEKAAKKVTRGRGRRPKDACDCGCKVSKVVCSECGADWKVQNVKKERKEPAADSLVMKRRALLSWLMGDLKIPFKAAVQKAVEFKADGYAIPDKSDARLASVLSLQQELTRSETTE